MREVNSVKKAEKRFLVFLISFFQGIKNIFVSFFKSIGKIINQKITVMFIPHSEKKVFNFRINLFMVFFTPFLIFSFLTVISIFVFIYFNKLNNYKDLNSKIQYNQKLSYEYKGIINEIIDNHSVFKTKLDQLLNQLNSRSITSLKENQINGVGGPVNRIDISDMTEFEKDKLEADSIINDYQYSILAFGEINKLAGIYNKLLKDLPFGSPVKGSYAITSAFGFRIHPVYKVVDMHQGLDMASHPGTHIVATAPGIVEKVEWNPSSYGWYCKVSHKLGFSTLYAHMRQKPVVNPGDKVRKGQLLGYMGSTGATTGNHLHYEVRLGNSLMNPIKFVTTY